MKHHGPMKHRESEIDLPRYPYVHVDVRSEQVELISLKLFESGALGVEERTDETMSKAEGGEVTLVASFSCFSDAERAIEALGAELAGSLQVVHGDAWRDAWRRFFQTTKIGSRLVVLPSWGAYVSTADEVVLTVDPGYAFGSGMHESTQLALAIIESRIQGGESVLDVGCGSGILTLATLLLGAKRAVGIDLDPVAIEVAKTNLTHSGFTDQVELSTCAITDIPGEYDLVVANIEADTLTHMATSLLAKIKPGGRLVLSGILAHQEDAMRPCFEGLADLEVHPQCDWIAMTARK
ncbi:MAG: 50S ribosomal protein L11 methyltransferase [Myxococcota bacterium]